MYILLEEEEEEGGGGGGVTTVNLACKAAKSVRGKYLHSTPFCDSMC